MFIFSQGNTLFTPWNRVTSRTVESTPWLLLNMLVNKSSSPSPWFSLLSCWKPQSYSRAYWFSSGLGLSVQRELGNRNVHPWAPWHRSSPRPWKDTSREKLRIRGQVSEGENSWDEEQGSPTLTCHQCSFDIERFLLIFRKEPYQVSCNLKRNTAFLKHWLQLVKFIFVQKKAEHWKS